MGPPSTGMSFAGSFVITNTIDEQTIAPFETITGDLEINAPGMTQVVLPNLRQIGGELKISNSDDLVTVSMPWLEQVGENMMIGTRGGITTRTNRALENVDLPALAQIGGSLRVTRNGTSLADWQPTKENPLPVFFGLHVLSFPSLTTVGYGIEIILNSPLEELSMPQLSSVDARNCGGITGCLTVLHDVAISNNISLPECRVDQLYWQLVGAGYGGGFVSGSNDEDGVCN